MSGPPYKRSARTVEIGDHLWELLTQMAAEMSADPHTLVNQALFAFARANGYLVPGEVVAKAPEPDRPPRAGRDGARGATGPMPALGTPDGSEGATGQMPALVVSEAPRPAPVKVDRLEKRRPPEPTQVAPPPAAPPEAVSSLADYLPDDLTGPRLAVPAREDRTMVGRLERKLFISVGGEAPLEVTGGRFVLGRDSATCQITLNSSRISRQHAVVVQGAAGPELEDLGSSNGTWFAGERITRRPIAHGDEYSLGDVTVRFEYR